MTTTSEATAPAPVRPGLGSNYRKLFAATTISNLGDGMSTIAYPWLASAITRNPLLIAAVAVAQRLPWLVFTLPAGVITDRVDRRRTMVLMDSFRFVLTLVVAIAVLGTQGSLPGPDEVDLVIGTRAGLYLLVIAATLLLGLAEVLRDNCGQTFMPSIVDSEHLEKANGRMWSAELSMNAFVGPPLGSLLLVAAFALPFFVDAASFFAAAALIAAIPGTYRAARPEGHRPSHWRAELAEGVRWLRAHPLLWPMAITLGLMNLASMMPGATLVLFAQEVLDVGPLLFTVMGFGAAAGGAIGGLVAPAASRRLGSGTCLAITLATPVAVSTIVGLTSSWVVVMIATGLGAFLMSSWNVITVSLRQTIIPPHLLGRVNSVYRFFAWGMIPLGAVLGGLLVNVGDWISTRGLGLRLVYFAEGAIHLGLFLFARAKLTTSKIEAARAAGHGMLPG
ncbi:MAG: MFS transporter [Ilumatobacteraceae bacterium]